ncbi:hypothetical protein DIPPA_01165 [Diplonema papillatum]|nr:hypothetical protein DIPPA_01165 [Diplonema papillatum]
MAQGYGAPRWSGGQQQQPQQAWGGGGKNQQRNSYGRQSWGEGRQSWGQQQQYGRPSWGQQSGGRQSWDQQGGRQSYGHKGGDQTQAWKGGKGKQHQPWHGGGKEGGHRKGHDGGKGGKKGDGKKGDRCMRWGEEMQLCEIVDRLAGTPICPDVTRVKPLWAADEFAHLPVVPTKHTKVAFVPASGTVEMPPAPETPAPLYVHVVLASVDQPRLNAGNHFGTRIKMLYLKDDKGALRLYGGNWAPEDGSDQSSPDTWAATARRQLAAHGLTIPEKTTFKPFLQFEYDRETTSKAAVVIAQWPEDVEIEATPMETDEKKKEKKEETDEKKEEEGATADDEKKEDEPEVEKTEEEKEAAEAKAKEDKEMAEALARSKEQPRLKIVPKVLTAVGDATKKVLTPHSDTLIKVTNDGRQSREEQFEYNFVCQQLHESMQAYAGINMYAALKRTKRKADQDFERIAKKKKLGDEFEADKQAALDKEKAVWNEETCDTTDDAREAFIEEKMKAFEQEWAEKKESVTKLVEELKPEVESLSADDTLTYIISYLERANNSATVNYNMHYFVMKQVFRSLRKELSVKQEQSFIELIKSTEGQGVDIAKLVKVGEDEKMEQDIPIHPKPKAKKPVPKKVPKTVAPPVVVKPVPSAADGEEKKEATGDVEMAGEEPEDKDAAKEEESKELKEEDEGKDAEKEAGEEAAAKEEKDEEGAGDEEDKQDEEGAGDEEDKQEEQQEEHQGDEDDENEEQEEGAEGEDGDEANASGELDEDTVAKLTYKQLQALCKERGLVAKGKADILRNRLLGKE